jgi:choice-of-anchor C domain-containing protein
MFPVALLLAASAPSAPVPKVIVELVKNGSFEDGPELTGWGMPVDKDSTKITGWTVTRGQIDYISPDHWAAADGKRSLDLHGSPGFGGVKQTLATKKGKTYTVTFQMAGNPGGTVTEKSVWVAAAGGNKKFTFDAKGKAVDKMGWEKQTWEFTATADETELEIYTAEEVDQFAGPALDNVSVKEKK